MNPSPFLDELLGYWENEDVDEEGIYVSSNPHSGTWLR